MRDLCMACGGAGFNLYLANPGDPTSSAEIEETCRSCHGFRFELSLSEKSHLSRISLEKRMELAIAAMGRPFGKKAV